MGKIQVGQKRPKTVDMGGFTIAPKDGATTEKKGGMTAEEKKALVEKIMQMPKDQIVPELRKHGFDDIADITEAQMEQYAEEDKKKARAARLAEIQAMDEQEQLQLLLEEGFEEEAKALSEKLASLNADIQGADKGNDGDTDGNDDTDGNGDESSDCGDGNDADGGQNDEQPEQTSEKKTSAKRGATKKN